MEEKRRRARWVSCPVCGNRTRTRVYEDTILIKFPLYCRTCKKETQIDVVQLKMVLSAELDV